MVRTSLVNINPEELYDTFFGNLLEGRAPKSCNRALEMRTDIKEFEDHYEANIDLPGVNKEDLDLSYEDGYLSLKAEVNKEVEASQDKGTYVHRERFTGSVSRSFYVGEIDEQGIKAKLDNGILNIYLPKLVAKEEPKRSITIE